MQKDCIRIWLYLFLIKYGVNLELIFEKMYRNVIFIDIHTHVSKVLNEIDYDKSIGGLNIRLNMYLIKSSFNEILRMHCFIKLVHLKRTDCMSVCLYNSRLRSQKIMIFSTKLQISQKLFILRITNAYLIQTLFYRNYWKIE